jgi:hypothetical protein
LFFTAGQLLFSQSKSAETIENELVTAFKVYKNANYEVRYDSLRKVLKSKFVSVLSNAETFTYNFEKLSKFVTIIRSKDKKVNMFSWDQLSSGNRHDMLSIIQYKNKNNKVFTKVIDTDIAENNKAIISDIFFEIFNIEISNKNTYLCFGWGTYGAGHHHNSILLFSIEKDSVKFNTDAIAKKEAFISAPRGKKIGLHYNNKEKLIIYNEFLLDDNIGFYLPTGKVVRLEFKDNKFIKSLN